MPQTPSILGQVFPVANTDTNLFTVGASKQAQFSIFVANHSATADAITIALVPSGGTENTASFIAFETPLIANAVIAFSGLFLNTGDFVQIKSKNGTSSFVATGLLLS